MKRRPIRAARPVSAAATTPALLHAWERTLARIGDRRAIVTAATGVVSTFGELDARAAAWRAAHPAVSRGDVVVFALPNGIGWFEVFLGLLRAGAVALPLDPGEPPDAQRRIAESVRAAFWWDGTRLTELPHPRRFREREICLIKLTSGTTGRPRPLVFTGAQMLADGRQVTATMGITARDLNHALIPLGHSYGLGNLTIPLVAHGVPLVSGSAALPHAVADDFARWQPTVFPTVPAVFRALAASDVPASAFASLRVAISAGAALTPETARAFVARFGRRIHNFYGSSETGGIAYDKSGAATLVGGVGIAMRGVNIRAPRGGRIEVCSAAVFTRGNSRRRGANGCSVPADRAHVDARGRVTLLGRRGSMVKLGGRRVDTAEIVGALRRVPGVQDAWVGVQDSAEPMLGAAVSTARSPTELRAELLRHLAPWKIPKKWVVVPALPTSARGKIDTRALHKTVFG
ncbi:MAG: class I adenylate-forming enzyme family protein [Opitutaceae bacterium]|nr:class I adenylate-forming enzyme family protein [Opitutaceae bacterium]